MMAWSDHVPESSCSRASLQLLFCWRSPRWLGEQYVLSVKDKGKLIGHSGKELVATRAGGSDGDGNFALPVVVTNNPARLRFVVMDAANGRIGTVDVKL